MRRMTPVLLALAVLAIVGCDPEPGSKAWCEQLGEKPKGDWSVNEATEYAKSCLLGDDEEKKD